MCVYKKSIVEHQMSSWHWGWDRQTNSLATSTVDSGSVSLEVS